MNTKADRPTATFKRLEFRPWMGSFSDMANLVEFPVMSLPVIWAGISLDNIKHSLATKYDEYTNQVIKLKGKVPQCRGDNPK